MMPPNNTLAIVAIAHIITHSNTAFSDTTVFINIDTS